MTNMIDIRDMSGEIIESERIMAIRKEEEPFSINETEQRYMDGVRMIKNVRSGNSEFRIEN